MASPASPGAQQGPLSSSGAVNHPSDVDNWSQSIVTLTSSEPVTALEVRVRIALTPNVANTGTWSSLPAEDLLTAIEQEPDALVYRFTLKPGVRLAPGSFWFAGQYNHATGGRVPSRDSYQAVATAAGSRVEVNGRF